VVERDPHGPDCTRHSVAAMLLDELVGEVGEIPRPLQEHVGVAVDEPGQQDAIPSSKTGVPSGSGAPTDSIRSPRTPITASSR